MTPLRTSRLGPRTVTRVGYGAMQLTGPGVFGPPADRDRALAVLRSAFVPFAPLGWPRAAAMADPTVVRLARRHAATPAQIARRLTVAERTLPGRPG